jgi:peptidoglycan/LPS O-acetylase OafA/YrhL
MWFVGYLLIISFLLLPLLIYLQKSKGMEKLSRLFSIFTTGYGIFLPAVPVVLIFALLAPIWPFFQNNLYTDWAHFTYHMLAFFFGFVMVSDSRFMETIDRVFRPALFGGAVLSIIKIIMDAYIPVFSKPVHHLNYAVYSMTAGLNTWCWVIGILGIARKRLNFSNRFLKYVNRISYPFYIWHLVIMVVAGYYITRWQLGIDIEFLLLCLVTLGGSLLACELVKRFEITRFLFGVK